MTEEQVEVPLEWEDEATEWRLGYAEGLNRRSYKGTNPVPDAGPNFKRRQEAWYAGRMASLQTLSFSKR